MEEAVNIFQSRDIFTKDESRTPESLTGLLRSQNQQQNQDSPHSWHQTDTFYTCVCKFSYRVPFPMTNVLIIPWDYLWDGMQTLG